MVLSSSHCRKKNIQYFDLSAKSNFNFEKPFLWLARRLTSQPELYFKGEFAHKPEIIMTEEQKMQSERELAEAANTAIEDEDLNL